MRDSVGDVVRKALYDRRFEAGEPLSEARLAGEMGISRGPVREALLVLVQEGLLAHSPNKGFSVVEFTKDDFKEINEVRLPLESTALTMAKPHVSSADLAQLSERKQRMVESYAAGEMLQCSQADMAFHSLIWERTGNGRMAATLKTLLAPFFAYGSLFSIGRAELTPKLLEEEHESFIQFLRGKGGQTAEDCVRFHLGM